MCTDDGTVKFGNEGFYVRADTVGNVLWNIQASTSTGTVDTCGSLQRLTLFAWIRVGNITEDVVGEALFGFGWALDDHIELQDDTLIVSIGSREGLFIQNVVSGQSSCLNIRYVETRSEYIHCKAAYRATVAVENNSSGILLVERVEPQDGRWFQVESILYQHTGLRWSREHCSSAYLIGFTARDDRGNDEVFVGIVIPVDFRGCFKLKKMREEHSDGKRNEPPCGNLMATASRDGASVWVTSKDIVESMSSVTISSRSVVNRHRGSDIVVPPAVHTSGSIGSSLNANWRRRTARRHRSSRNMVFSMSLFGVLLFENNEEKATTSEFESSDKAATTRAHGRLFVCFHYLASYPRQELALSLPVLVFKEFFHWPALGQVVYLWIAILSLARLPSFECRSSSMVKTKKKEKKRKRAVFLFLEDVLTLMKVLFPRISSSNWPRVDLLFTCFQSLNTNCVCLCQSPLMTLF